MPKREISASGKRFQFFLKIINANFAAMRFYVSRKSCGGRFTFRLALAAGLMF